MRPSATPAVSAWIAGLDAEALYLTAVSAAKPPYGIAIVPAGRRSGEHPIAPADCQIAAITRSRGMAVATRNVRDFEDIGITVVDPWTAA